VWSEEQAIKGLANELMGATAVGDVQWCHLVHALGLHLGMQDSRYTGGAADGTAPRPQPNIPTLAQLIGAAGACLDATGTPNAVEEEGESVVLSQDEEQERFMDTLRLSPGAFEQVRFQHFDPLCPALEEPKLMRTVYHITWQLPDGRIDM
jgi:hypothetical protein